jgi:prevent-host-death family protein
MAKTSPRGQVKPKRYPVPQAERRAPAPPTNPEPEPGAAGEGPKPYRVPRTEMLHAAESLTPSVSVAEMRGKLAEIVDAVERGQRMAITRRGKPVAVLLSVEELRRLTSPRPSFSAAYALWRAKFEPDVDVAPGYFESLRDKAPGRDVELG